MTQSKCDLCALYEITKEREMCQIIIMVFSDYHADIHEKLSTCQFMKEKLRICTISCLVDIFIIVAFTFSIG